MLNLNQLTSEIYMAIRNKKLTIDLALLRKFQRDTHYLFPTPSNTDEPNFLLMKAIVESWPKNKLTSSRHSIDATYFGFLIGIMTAQAHYMSISEEKQIIKKIFKGRCCSSDQTKGDFGT